MENLRLKSVGEIVADDYRTAAVFQKYGIDFCLENMNSIDEVSINNKISAAELLADLVGVSKLPDYQKIDFQSWPLDLLAVYLEKKFHRQFDHITPVILQYLDKICEIHGNSHPELIEINEQFNAAAGELAMHMKKEEFIIFPYIRKMVVAKNNPENAGWPSLGPVDHPIQLMMLEHDIEGERFKKIAILCDNYNPPPDACDMYKATFSLLREFDDDLKMHIYLEENILYIKAIELKKKSNSEKAGQRQMKRGK